MITPLLARGVDDVACSRPSLVLSCFVDFISLFGRFNSLFGRLGSFLSTGQISMAYRRNCPPRTGREAISPSIFPSSREPQSAAGGRLPPGRLPHPPDSC